MDCEGGGIDRPIALNNLPFIAHKHQISRCHMGKMNTERVDPEPVRVFGVSDRDVSRQSLVITEMCKQTKGGSQPLFAMFPFRLYGVKLRRHQVRRCPGVPQRGAFGHGVHSVRLCADSHQSSVKIDFSNDKFSLEKIRRWLDMC